MSAIRLIRNILLVPALLTLAACAEFDGFMDDFSPPTKPEHKKIEPRAEAAPVQPVDVVGNPVTLGHMRAKEAPSTDIEIIRPESPKTPAVSTTQQVETVSQPIMVEKPSSAPVPNTPLLVIRFNQPHVYYEDAVTKAVRAVEATKPNALYDLVSVLPDISSLPTDKQIKIATRSNDNMRSVATLMQQLGVPAQRIRISNRQSPVNSQEILVFIQ